MFPPRQRFPRRPRVPQENRPESKTTLFVANLPFIVDDNNLKEIFADLNIKEAHVVRRQNGRSKGYGFVEFHSEEDRRHALQTLDKIEVEGRELIIKAALTFTPRTFFLMCNSYPLRSCCPSTRPNCSTKDRGQVMIEKFHNKRANTCYGCRPAGGG